MAYVLIAVPDPWEWRAAARRSCWASTHGPASAAGPCTGCALPRSALREESKVWIYQDGLLEIRPVTVVWRDADTVYLSGGVSPGERIVTTDIATPVEGMKLRLPDQDQAKDQTPTTRGDVDAG